MAGWIGGDFDGAVDQAGEPEVAVGGPFGE